MAQINAGWVLHDRNGIKRAKQYFKWNLIHFMASDTHSVERRAPNLEQGYEKLPEQMRLFFRKMRIAFFGVKNRR